jgi:hypothetical protein
MQDRPSTGFDYFSDGPEIQLKVYGLFSDVKVTDQPG